MHKKRVRTPQVRQVLLITGFIGFLRFPNFWCPSISP